MHILICVVYFIKEGVITSHKPAVQVLVAVHIFLEFGAFLFVFCIVVDAQTKTNTLLYVYKNEK